MVTIKSCEIFKAVSVEDSANVIEVAKKLHEFQERRVFVLNSKKYPIGIISIVDINDRVVAKAKDLKKTKAKDIMTYPLSLVFDINEDINGVANKMLSKNNFYCPVVDKGIFKGIITYASLLKVFGKKSKS